MILESLRALALRERLVEEPAFESVGVRWVIDLSKDGRFLSVTDTGFIPVSRGKRKQKSQPKRMSIPRRSGRTVNSKAELLVDKSEYVLGILPSGQGDTERLEQRRLLFLEEMIRTQNEVHAPEMDAALSFLTSLAERSRCAAELERQKFASNDLFVLRVEGHLLTELSAVRAYCHSVATEPGDAAVRIRQCLVCGEERLPAEKHDLLKIAGGVTSGVPLVSFNKPAFEKHGLSGNENAPVCRACMLAYVTALRRTLAGYPNPQGGNFERQSVMLSQNTTAVFWADGSSPLTEALPMLNEDPSVVEKLLTSPWKGEASASPETPFYCLLLTGAQGRAILRGMHTSTLGAASNNLKTYFDCLHYSGYNPEPAPVHVLLRSLAVRGKLDSLPPGLAAEVFLSAVLGEKLSTRFLAAAVARNRAERQVTRPRVALLLLYFKLSSKEKISMALDPQSLDPAYRYGRLLAVLESLQYRAQGKINSTIVDRFYGAASTRPATVFPRLLHLAQAHLHKIKARSFFKGRIEDIIDGLDGAAGFRSMLNIEEQGRFALGYFHERATQFTKAADGPAEVNETGNNEETES
jgi:CRISPR-associated protein Csd1